MKDWIGNKWVGDAIYRGEILLWSDDIAEIQFVADPRQCPRINMRKKSTIAATGRSTRYTGLAWVLV